MSSTSYLLCRFIAVYVKSWASSRRFYSLRPRFVGLSTIVKCAGVPNCQCLIATRSAYCGMPQALISIPLFGRHLHCLFQ